MRIDRGFLAFLAVVPAVGFFAHPAKAESRTLLTPRAGTSLSHGIHLAASGRYLQDVCSHATDVFCLSERLLPADWVPGKPIPQTGSATPTGMTPSDVLAAYAIPSSASAGGAVVAILDSPDSQAFADLTAYRSQFNLPAMNKCPLTAANVPTFSTTPCFGQVAEDGTASTGGDSAPSGDIETSLDMDMISAGCPDCSILLVEISNLENADIVTAVASAKSFDAVAISISLGGAEATDPSCTGTACTDAGDPTGNGQFTTPGHLVLAASGDFGYLSINNPTSAGGDMSPSYPASAPDVLAVGGTNLILDGTTYDEAVWNDGTFNTSENGQDVTTSGCSTEFPMPSWQANLFPSSLCSMRATADLSAAATFATKSGTTLTAQDIAIYQAGWQPVEGTSASAPLVAGLFTRLGLIGAISNNLAWEYSNPSAFNDLGSAAYPSDPAGSNTDSTTTSCGVLCTVGPGWDGPSGVGTPNGAKLFALGTGVADSGAMDAGVAAPDSGAPTDDGGEEETGSVATATCSCATPGRPSGSRAGWASALALAALGTLAFRRQRK
jgi:MYXO-CTERM domain-containing protein